MLASYEAGSEEVAYLEPLAVGQVMPDMPLFLSRDFHIYVPLESTYQAAWNASPEMLRTAVETGVMPEDDADAD